MTTADFPRCPSCPTTDACGFLGRCLDREPDSRAALMDALIADSAQSIADMPGGMHDPGEWRRVPSDVELEDQHALAVAAGGHKADAGKLPMHLLAPELLEGVAAVLAFGAAKYAPRNWERGLDWSRAYSAAQRHLWAWWGGEDRDAETGLSHLAHAACCLMFLVAYERRGVGADDRPPRNAPEIARSGPVGGQVAPARPETPAPKPQQESLL